jgi:ComF family protein
VVACDYDFPWDSLVARFKSGQGGVDAHTLTSLLQHAIVSAARDGHVRALESSIVDPGETQAIDLVLPMPASDERLRERGFNPAWEVARRLARMQALPTSPWLLRKWQHTPPQRGLSRLARERNLRGVFGVVEAERHRLAGAHLALVDDVMTTGATAAEATRTLLNAGAASVSLWVVARTDASHHAVRLPACSTSCSSNPKSRPTPAT